jgi:hypothetical protein
MGNACASSEITLQRGRVILEFFVFTSDTWHLAAPGLQEPFWQRVFGGEATRDNWMEERYARLFGAPQGMEGKVGPVLGSFHLPKTCWDLFIRDSIHPKIANVGIVVHPIIPIILKLHMFISKD